MKLYIVISSCNGRRDVDTVVLATTDQAALARINRRFPEKDGWSHTAHEKDSAILACSEDSP